MARKKAKTKKAPAKRRRMGSVSRVTLMDGVKLVGGLAIGSIAATAADNAMRGINPKLSQTGKIVIGLMMSKSRSEVMKGAGFGIASSGAIGLAHNLGILQQAQNLISGIYDSDGDYEMNGISNEQLVSGINNEQIVSQPAMDYANIRPEFYDPYNPGTLGGIRRRMGGLGG